MLNLSEIRTINNFDTVPGELKGKILKHFGFEYHYEGLDDFLEDYKVSETQVDYENDIVALPFTVFDLRGDGNTDVLESCFINLKITKKIEIHATGVFLCEKENAQNPSYATYLLDNQEILIIEIR